MTENVFAKTAFNLIANSSTAINYLAEKYYQTCSQIDRTLDKLVENKEYLTSTDDLNFLRFTIHHKVNDFADFSSIYPNLYADSVLDYDKAKSDLSTAISDIQSTGTIIQTFDSLSLNIIVVAGLVDTNPNEYETIAKYYHTLENLFEELDNNYQALATTLKNIEFLYESVL